MKGVICDLNKLQIMWLCNGFNHINVDNNRCSGMKMYHFSFLHTFQQD